VRDYYDRLLLMTAYPKLIHTKFAQRRQLPRKMGDTIVFRRYNRLATVPIPLQDGVTPPGTALSTQDLKARVDFYGNFVTLTNQVEFTVQDRVLNESARLLAQNLGQTMDEVTRDVLASTSSVLQCANGSNGNTPTEINKLDLDIAVKTLLGNNAEMISEVITGMDMFGTAPVRPAFWGYMDTGLLDDLEQVSNFVSIAQYPSQQTVLDAEWGSTGNIRWLYTSVGSVSSASPAVYNNFIIGKEAYAVVHLGVESGEFYIEPLGSAGSADPLHQRGTVGWQHPFVSRILNDSFMLNLEATHS
jgi:N4-gp56 family major capsid protein